jgi:hypothetical protein
MKKFTLAVAVVMLVVAMAGMAMAATQTVAVSANVVGVYHFLPEVQSTFIDRLLRQCERHDYSANVLRTRGYVGGITDDSGTHELVAAHSACTQINNNRFPYAL